MRLRQEKRRRSAGSSAAEGVRNSAGIDAGSEIEVKDMINGNSIYRIFWYGPDPVMRKISKSQWLKIFAIYDLATEFDNTGMAGFYIR